MINSITKSTLKQYESSLRFWWNFTQSNDIDMYHAKTTDIIKFLNNRFNTNIGYSALNTDRAAISLISAYDINSDGLIGRFMKGIYKIKPTKPKYNSTWDITPVLDYLEKLRPLKDLKLMEATQKVATLLALTSAQRLQTLALIKINNIEKNEKEIRIKITDQIKTSKPGSYQPELILPFFKDRPKICVASIVLEYIEITKSLRDKNNTNLFITTTKPFGAASSQTISHWIKGLLKDAGIDTNVFSAYSTRHASVSAAHKRGVDIDTIRRSAGWAPSSQTFFKFYNKPIVSSNESFTKVILSQK